jgi:aldehyde:ferredoxin oxidoreductase
VHPLGPRYDSMEHDIDFDPVDGDDLFIEGARDVGCPPGGLPMDTLNETKIELVANLMELWSGYAIGLCVFVTPPTRGLTKTPLPS